MIFTETRLKDAFIVDVYQIEDERGFSGKAFCQLEFIKRGLNGRPLQTNFNYNKTKGTLRGMHMQAAPFEQTKLVRCTRGSVYDVIIDLRPNSKTFKQWLGIELSQSNYRMLYIPEGFAHGFLTLEDETDVTCQVTQNYTSIAELGYRWDDPAFNITWPEHPLLLSAKDQAHPFFKDGIPDQD
jgi:dTDP-4-dehydrorhamnose 3,5-epimerase